MNLPRTNGRVHADPPEPPGRETPTRPGREAGVSRPAVRYSGMRDPLRPFAPPNARNEGAPCPKAAATSDRGLRGGSRSDERSAAGSCPPSAAVTREFARLLPVDFADSGRLESDGTVTVVGAWGRAVERFPVGTRWRLG